MHEVRRRDEADGEGHFPGCDIREYECGSCGHSEWEDSGPALWQILADAREEDEAAERSANRPTAEPEPAAVTFWNGCVAGFAGLLKRKR